MREALLRFGLDPMLAAAFLALALAGAWVLLRLQGWFGGNSATLVSPASVKLAPLEGLRGILAFSVAAHHACCWWYFTRFAVWTTGPSVLFDRLADFGVMQFFFLSGFLFWRKLIKSGQIPMGRFYLSRFIRIAPVYYVCVGTAIAIGLVATGFRLTVPASELTASLVSWTLFSLGGLRTVNHANILRITAGVTWTLALEWLFYLSLPFLAWFARRVWRLAVYALVFGVLFLAARHLRTEMGSPAAQFAGSVLAEYAKFMLAGFGGGILIAALEPRLRDWLRPSLRFGSWIVLACYLAYLMIPRIGPAGQALLLVGFAFVVLGTDLFGLLTSRPARLLGVISYPVYLVHGVVYYTAMRLRGGTHLIGLSAYVAETAVCLLVVLGIAVLIHLLIERPTMRISERIARAAKVPQNVS